MVTLDHMSFQGCFYQGGIALEAFGIHPTFLTFMTKVMNLKGHIVGYPHVHGRFLCAKVCPVLAKQ